MAALRFLERLGARLTWLPVDGTGLVDPDDLWRAITSDTVLDTAASLAADHSPLVEVQSLRDRLWDGLSEAFGDGVVLNGHPERRLPNTLNVAFGGARRR